MSDIIIKDPNSIIVNDGGSGGDSNILDVTWNVEAEYGPVATDGDGNEIPGLVNIKSELDGITIGEILDHIDNGGLIRYHLNETAPDGYGLWIMDTFQFPSDSVVCDGRYILELPNSFVGVISVDGVFVQPYLNDVAMITGADGPVALLGDENIFQFPVDISLFGRGVSSGSLKKSQDDDGSPFISQPVGDIGFLLRTIEDNSDEESVSNKQYSIYRTPDGFPIIEELIEQGQQEEPATISSLKQIIDYFITNHSVSQPETPQWAVEVITDQEILGQITQEMANIENIEARDIIIDLNHGGLSGKLLLNNLGTGYQAYRSFYTSSYGFAGLVDLKLSIVPNSAVIVSGIVMYNTHE